VVAMFVNGLGQNEQSLKNKGSSIDASYQVSVHLAKRFQRRRFKKIGQSETRIACGSHVCQHGRHKPFLFLIGRFLKNLLL
jgi:hypothetical protein